MVGRLTLDDVTLCAGDSTRPELTARALEICMQKCDFADAVLFSDAPVAGTFRWEKIDPVRSKTDYARFCLRDLPRRIATPFVLVVQWDGYVVDPAAWLDRFRRYDYIGAPMNTGWIGNGGFSLRSRKLLNLLPSLPLIPDKEEDMMICVLFRETITRDHGIRISPEPVANRFAYEFKHLGKQTFGFHRLFNVWRHESDDEVMALAEKMLPSDYTSWQAFGLMKNCFNNDRRDLALRLYRMAKGNRSADQMKFLMSRGLPPATVEQGVDQLEALL